MEIGGSDVWFNRCERGIIGGDEVELWFYFYVYEKWKGLDRDGKEWIFWLILIRILDYLNKGRFSTTALRSSILEKQSQILTWSSFSIPSLKLYSHFSHVSESGEVLIDREWHTLSFLPIICPTLRMICWKKLRTHYLVLSHFHDYLKLAWNNSTSGWLTNGKRILARCRNYLRFVQLGIQSSREDSISNSGNSGTERT